MRKPIVAGMFYSENAEELENEIKECFFNKNGPGKIESNENVKAVIAPHAGYKFSGACQAWAYKEILASEAKTFVIVGTNHNNMSNVVTLEDFETPFGIVKNNNEITKELISMGIAHDDPETHAKEHSIEVQLPFLQHVKKDFDVVPLLVGKVNDLVIERFKSFFERHQDVFFIISSDFTHYGFNYGYVPFTENVKENLEKLDKGAIEFIEKLDPEGFQLYVDEKKATICGAKAITLLLHALKEKKIDVQLLKYYSSGDILGDYSSSVGYAAISFKDAKE